MNDIDFESYFEDFSDFLDRLDTEDFSDFFDRLDSYAREYHEGDPPSVDTNSNEGGN